MIIEEKELIPNYSKSISWVVLDNELFVFDEKFNEIIMLKGAIKKFWMLIDGKNSLGQIINSLSSQLNCNKNDISDKILKKVDDFILKEILILE